MKDKLVWESMENRLARPKPGSLFIVKGYVIYKGRREEEFRLAMFSISEFIDYTTQKPFDDMVIENWAVLKD